MHWALYLSRFDFILKHIPGTKIEKIDGLSRRLNWKIGVEKDNNDQVFIKDCWIHNLYEVVIDRSKVEIVEKIKKARSKDEEVIKVVEEIKKAGVKMLWGEEWQIKGELMLKERKVYVPKDEELRGEIIWLYHDVPVVRHGGK